MPAATSDDLSFGQRRLWFLDRFSPGLAIYNIPAAVRIRGPLNAGALGTAFGEVVRRHEILRTVFSSVDGRPRQHVEPPVPFHLEEHDLRDADAASRDAEARRRAVALAAEPFDLTTGPLLRAALYRTADEEHLLAVVAHHIVSDGASTELLIHEVTTISLALALDRPAALPPLSCQYSAYAAWQHAQFANGSLGAQLAYWRHALEEMPGVLGLPTDHPRGPMRHTGAKLEYPLAGIRHEQVAALAAAHETTAFTVLLAAFNTLLARYAGSADIVVGTPVNHRPLAEFEPLIGFFVNTLVLRTRMDGDPPFATVVDRTRRTCVDAMANRDVPFELLVQELNPTRLLSQNPLVQVMFSYQPESRERAAARGISIEPVTIHLPLAKLDLSVYVTRRGEQLIAVAEYDTGLFAAASVERLMRHYRALLQEALRDPTRPVSLLDWLAPDEQPVVRGGPPLASGTADSTIHAAVAAQMRATPHAPAVVDADGVLTYAELEGRARVLARMLTSQGVEAGARIAIAVTPSAP